MTIIVTHQQKILDIADEIVVLNSSKVDRFGPAKDILPSLKDVTCKNLRRRRTMDKIDKDLLAQISDLHKIPEGAYNIRKNGQALSRNSTSEIEINPKKTRVELILL